MKNYSTEAAILMLKGFAMGAADVVPGVSGGTMAFILGIYTRLIDAIKSFDRAWFVALIKLDIQTTLSRPHFAFLLPLGSGIVVAVIFFTRVIPIPKLLHTHPEVIYSLFFGLVVGSIFVLSMRIKWRSAFDGIAVLVGLALGGLVVSAVPTQTPDTWWFIMASGSVAICAMVLPGISGSFTLLILGKYATVLDGIGNFNLSIILPFALGAAIGLAAFTRLLSWLLHRFEHTMLLVISGFLLASLWVIWPFQQRHYITVRGKQRLLESIPTAPQWDVATLQALLVAVVGLALVVGASQFAGRIKPSP